ncbi:MAG: phosphate acyltransferase PlsX [Clostridia bacterium]|nr:phosphate acyltransferase PlsX [Clostridia bacterium]
MHTIAIDAMGGDFAPDAAVLGSLRALRGFENLRIVLVGRAERIAPLLQGADAVKERLSVVDARETIETSEPPVMALRRKPDSSLVRAFMLVREGEADAMVTAGSTGAVMTGAMVRLGRIPGIDRPALGVLLPTVTGASALLIDTGANVDCRPGWLLQFAKMGDVYMRQVMGVAKPRIALLGIGEEAEKGNLQTKEAYALLEASGLHFIGNLEGRGVPLGEADVVVADGFAGNVLLKTMEGAAQTFLSLVKHELTSGLRTKLGALLAKPAFVRLKKQLSADEVGGAPLLGTPGAVVKAHGNSNEYAFFCAIKQALAMLTGNVVSIIQGSFAE